MRCPPRPVTDLYSVALGECVAEISVMRRMRNAAANSTGQPTGLGARTGARGECARRRMGLTLSASNNTAHSIFTLRYRTSTWVGRAREADVPRGPVVAMLAGVGVEVGKIEVEGPGVVDGGAPRRGSYVG